MQGWNMSVVIDQHTLLCGATQTGKTFACGKLLETKTTPLTLYFNTQGAAAPRQNADIICGTIEEVIEALQEYTTVNICYEPSEDIDIAKAQLKELQELFFAIGSQINTSIEVKKWITIFIDEVTDLSSKQKVDTALSLLFRRGAGKGIICVALTQHPGATSQIVLTQSSQLIFFRLLDFEKPYMARYFGHRFDELYAWLDKKYHFVVFRDNVVYKETPM